jgi:tRNA(Ile2)-agmatinylcytidine synthase
VYDETVRRYAKREGVVFRGGKGVVGAIASLAALMPGEPYTYELIAYRHPDKWGEKRCVHDNPSVEACIPPCTFNNVDLYTWRTVAAPHGPDPILAGFRGTCPGGLGCYRVLLCEKPQFWVLYRSNQHTDSHLLTPRLTPYSSTKLELKLASQPKRIPGNHVIALGKHNNTTIPIAAYRESYPIRELLSQLWKNTMLTVGGTIRPRKEGHTLSLEKIYRIQSPPSTISVNPRCPKCGTRMKSLGRLKGYRCPRCGYKSSEIGKTIIPVTPRIASAPVTPLPGQISHLTKPSYIRSLPSNPPEPPTWDMVVSVGADPPVGTIELCRC